ncbi:hypothetical protein [Anaeromyxobacter diazotrophicus]|uniref:Uncharacterized protein n=1 Tax=Anaeromyxobacter diazotrophicus TaxID=2590199 RepID=A0A7I9VGW7_9BACT|nr:hypothetical protein [Anaeromyxobacter diazotrophicus]GEJ55277.1 hypothetical protein AMYX_00180 [Anaeromyxobacter diazotrophicus]
MRPLALILLAALPAAAQQQAVPGSVRADRAAVEVLPPKPGATELRTPEGFLRLEGGPPLAGTGTFGVYPAGSRMPPPPALVAGAARAQASDAAVAAPPAKPGEPCRPERARYLRRLLYMSGIDLADPVGFLDGLAGREGAAGSFLFTAYGLLPGVDPIRPLAWDFELQSLARELAACQRARAP